MCLLKRKDNLRAEHQMKAGIDRINASRKHNAIL